ncbi:MAG: SpaA isopeptide-forming pilin-related protein, partial [Oscillospiraceae bacterium]|nr:SpaA isopeptide-forming pilin-related protein [Oscillospiraceae bacterium]
MLNFKKIYILLCTILFVCLGVVLTSTNKVQAKIFSGYSYSKVYNALPEKYQSSDYIYNNNNIGYIQFANYKNNPYRMSVKKSSTENDFVYCVDYSKHIVLNTSYAAKNNLFNDTLRTKIGIALSYGTIKWGTKASSNYTTGNAIVDYYMTQIVIHSLIYKYGNDKSNYGIDYSELSFYKNTNSLQKKSKELYDFCCKTKVTLPNGSFENNKFSFKKDNFSLYLSDNEVISDLVECDIASDNADVSSFTRKLSSKSMDSSKIKIQTKDDTYHSAFQLHIPISSINKLTPGKHIFSVTETVDFNPYIAAFWNCTDTAVGNSGQEVGGLFKDSVEVKDSLSLDLLIGEVSLKKTDSISGDIIEDATFSILQYDDAEKKYVKYKDLYYDADTKLYKSGNIYANTNNTKAKFKIVEGAPGKNYINDWKGQTFQLTDKIYTFEFDVENTPIMGSLQIKKTGDNPSFSDNKISYSPGTSLQNVSFDLFAEEDIYLKKKLIYKANQKILQLTTNDKGIARADELPLGKYYLKETTTNEYHTLDDSLYHFVITQDKNRKYSEIKFDIKNHRKLCEIQLFKYAFDRKDTNKKIPLNQAKFGLYAAEDIIDLNGTVIIVKDTLIAEGITDKSGMITFSDLLYANYYLKELEAPKGYVINDGILPIPKEDFTKTDDNKYITLKDCVNQEKEYSIQLQKNGEIFTQVKQQRSTNGKFITYETATKPLSDVTYTLYDADNKVVQSEITDDNGIISISHLLTGDYYLIETKAPKEYIKNSKKIKFTITD